MEVEQAKKLLLRLTNFYPCPDLNATEIQYLEELIKDDIERIEAPYGR